MAVWWRLGCVAGWWLALSTTSALAALALDFQITLDDLPVAADDPSASIGSNLAAISGDNAGSLYLGGGTTWSGPFFRHDGVGGLQPLLTKHTDGGDLVWARPIYPTGSGQVLQVEAAPGGAGVYVAGQRSLRDPNGQSPNDILPSTGFVGLWDADGREVWSLDVSGPADPGALFNDTVFDDVTVIAGGDVAVSGRVGSQAAVHRYDPTGVGGPVWGFPAGEAEFSRVYVVEPFDDGDLLLVGDFVPAGADVLIGRGFAKRVSPTGEERWSLELPLASESTTPALSSSLFDGAVTSDGGAFLVGSSVVPGGTESATAVRFVRDGVVQWTRTLLDRGTTLYATGGASDDFYVHGQQDFSGPATVTRYNSAGVNLGQAVFDASAGGSAAPFGYASDVFVDDQGVAYAVGQSGEQWFVSVISGPLAGDFNLDGVVDAADYTIWRDFESVSGPNVPGDANGDGLVNAVDYAAWADSYGQVRVSGATPVPAPCALTIAVVAGAALGGRPGRRRRR
ncbi:MAG: hypothetical protein AAF805_08300 [Planctomycetota bacterium]